MNYKTYKKPKDYMAHQPNWFSRSIVLFGYQKPQSTGTVSLSQDNASKYAASSQANHGS